MKKFFIFLSNYHEQIFKYAIILGSVLLIVAALPYDTQFSYEIRMGKPWPYEPVIAPFDFAISKSELELTKERIDAKNTVHPVFVMDTSVATENIEGFTRAFMARFPANGNELELCVSVLTEVYEKGIMQFAERPNMKNLSTVTVIRNNYAEDRSMTGLFTVRTAIEYCTNTIAKNYPSHRNALESLFQDYIAHNVFYDNPKTIQFQNQAQENISLTHGMVQSGELIISKGDVVNEDKYQKLHSLRMEMQSMELNFYSRIAMRIGHFIIVSAAIAMLIIFLAQFRKEIFAENRKIFFLMLQIVGICYLYFWLRELNVPSHYIAPVCMLPIVVRAFFDTRVAMFTSIVTLLILSFIAPDGFDYMFIQVIAGMTATFSIVNLRSRSQFFITVGIIFITYLVTYTGVSVLHRGNIFAIDVDNIKALLENVKWLLVSSVLSLAAFPLIFLFEKIFRFLSDVSLMELADSNRPLLRELALKAPGTFQHSLQVANLAEAAVYRIGGNTLLVRAGALYHDVGKIEMPLYFMENLSTQNNPHDDLSFEESAGIITSHVIKGIELARKKGIPDQIIDFIRTHHGTTFVQYFYQSFLKTFPQEELKEERFRYPGPLPFSKETAVLMMADSVEAASRSLKKPDQQSIDTLVEKVIGSQLAQEQFINCPVTMRDISEVKKIFKKMLMSIYHVRAEYPEH